MSHEVTLKEDLEILRGEPIREFSGSPLDIPCVETSDPERLCRHPLVSVHMITYNHEPYIRQAIEGVMMQKTDFEFELVIGEDCSSDCTREICFEYQKRYPEKIRVLWSEKNLYRNQHIAGGNSKRVSARCRGEFIAFCEGDDYWVDPHKLQSQVDAFRNNPTVGLCFTGARIYSERAGSFSDWDSSAFPVGFIPGRDFFLWHLFGKDPYRDIGGEGFIMTASVMLKKEVLNAAMTIFPVLNWRLSLGDTTKWLAVSALCDVFFLGEKTTVYRLNPSGSMSLNGWRVALDSNIVRIWFAVRVIGLSQDEAFEVFANRIYHNLAFFGASQASCVQRLMAKQLVSNAYLRRCLCRFDCLVCYICVRLGAMRRFLLRFFPVIFRWRSAERGKVVRMVYDRYLNRHK